MVSRLGVGVFRYGFGGIELLVIFGIELNVRFSGFIGIDFCFLYSRFFDIVRSWMVIFFVWEWKIL